jgi:hypothetical protein
MMLVSIALATAALGSACTQPRSQACTDICSRESECITSTKSEIPFDEKECVAACEVLRNDEQNLAKVEQHRECVMKNVSCPAVLECQ